jgi:hypothetical protein
MLTPPGERPPPQTRRAVPGERLAGPHGDPGRLWTFSRGRRRSRSVAPAACAGVGGPMRDCLGSPGRVGGKPLPGRACADRSGPLHSPQCPPSATRTRQLAVGHEDVLPRGNGFPTAPRRHSLLGVVPACVSRVGAAVPTGRSTPGGPISAGAVPAGPMVAPPVLGPCTTPDLGSANGLWPGRPHGRRQAPTDACGAGPGLPVDPCRCRGWHSPAARRPIGVRPGTTGSRRVARVRRHRPDPAQHRGLRRLTLTPSRARGGCITPAR